MKNTEIHEIFSLIALCLKHINLVQNETLALNKQSVELLVQSIGSSNNNLDKSSSQGIQLQDIICQQLEYISHMNSSLSTNLLEILHINTGSASFKDYIDNLKITLTNTLKEAKEKRVALAGYTDKSNHDCGGIELF